MKQVFAGLAIIAVAVGAFNFLWALSEGQRLGGSALNGHQADGRCFVYEHGSTTEVSCVEWSLRRMQEASILLTHPLAMLGMGYLLFGFLFPLAIGGRQDQATQQAQRVREKTLSTGGPPLAVGSPGGQVGGVRMSAGLLGVSVFADGLLVKPMFMKSAVVFKSEINGLHIKKGIFRNQYIEVRHSSPAMKSPLVLYASPESAVGRAIESMAGMAFEAH